MSNEMCEICHQPYAAPMHGRGLSVCTTCHFEAKEAAQPDFEMQKRRNERYEEIAEQLCGGWGERALVRTIKDEASEWWAELDNGDFVMANLYGDDPGLTLDEHQTIVHQVVLALGYDDHELRVVEWDESPFPDDPEEWERL